MQQTNLIMGLWKFSDKISPEELASLAHQWADEDQNYVQLYIRKVSKDQAGIGFTYRVPEHEDPHTAYDTYFSRISDALKRQFGNELVGWDIAAQVVVIK